MMLSVIDTELWLSAVVEIEDTVGAVVSITNELIFNVTLLLELSVTVIVPAVAEVVLEEQEPP